MKSYEEHKKQAPTSVRCMVITISDTRTPETDTSGRFIVNSLKEHGHTLTDYQILKDEPDDIRYVVLEAARSGAIDAILLNGGTGISLRDGTYEAISGILDKRLDGFGEIFRMLSFQEIGPPAILSRAVAGVVGGTVVISMPGSEGAVRLAMERILLPELAHMVYEITKQKPK